MGNTCSNATLLDDCVYAEQEAKGFSNSPPANVVRVASSQTGAQPTTGEGSVHSEQQPAQAICHQHSGSTAGPQLHDSAASGSSIEVDQVNNRAEFLTRKDTANVNEASHISPEAAKPASGEVGLETAHMAPFEARKTFLLGPPKPACCPERFRTAEGINKLRLADDPDIDSLLRLSCKVFGCDMALCTLLTGDVHHIVAGTGILIPGICPDRWGFCAWSFLNTNHELLVVEDMTKDTRLSENFFVKDPHFDLRFYAGCPLVTSNGHRLGTLCIVGQQPGEFDATRGQVLANITELLVRRLEHKWAQAEARRSSVQLMRSLACYDQAFMFLDTLKQGDWHVLHMNKAASKLLDWDWLPVCLADAAEAKAGAGQTHVAPSFPGVPLSTILDLQPDCMMEGVGKAHMVPSVMGAAGTPAADRPFQLHMRQARTDSISPEALQVGSPSYLRDNLSYGQHYYIAALVPLVSEQPQELGHATPSPQPVPTCVGGPTYGRASKHFACLPSTGPFEGLLLGSLVGRGSFGRVYRGLWKGQLVGVKVVRDINRLKLDPSGEPVEALLTRDLKHRSMMKTLTHAWWKATDRGGAGGEQQCWMLLEYCDKGSIVDAVQRGWFRTSSSPLTGQPDLRTVAMTALEVASAMSFLHSKDIVHGDLSGGNVMLTSCSINPHGFQAKVGDFGLSREASASGRLAGNLYGTITHMAPEVMLAAQMGLAADVYAFGVLLWEMLSSSRAWAGLRHAHIVCMVGVQKQTLATPPGLHPTLGTLLRHCLARKPEARPSFQSIVDTLSHFVQVTRGVDPAELWGASTLTTPTGGCVCSQAGGADCCITCSHTSVCAKASCFRCQFASVALPTASPRKTRHGMSSDSDATASQAQKESPSMPIVADAASSQVSQQSHSCTAVSKLDMKAAIALTQADQAKPSTSSTTGGKGMKRTLLST